MQQRFAILALAAALAATVPAPAAPNLDKLIAKHLEAMGGSELKELRGFCSQGIYQTEHSSGDGYPFELWVRRPGGMRFELAGSYLMVLNGTAGWQGSRGAVREMPSQQVPRDRRNVAFDGLNPTNLEGADLRLLGQGHLGGRAAHLVRVDFANGDAGIFYLDAETFLVVKMREVWQIGEHRVELTRTFSDYREIDGIQIPHVVEQTNSQGWRRFRLHDVQVNPELEDALFEAPAAAPADNPTSSEE